MLVFLITKQEQVFSILINGQHNNDVKETGKKIGKIIVRFLGV